MHCENLRDADSPHARKKKVPRPFSTFFSFSPTLCPTTPPAPSPACSSPEASSPSSFQSSHHRRHPLRRPRALLLLAAGVLTLLALAVLLGPAVGLPELPIPEHLAGYYPPPPRPAFGLGTVGTGTRRPRRRWMWARTRRSTSPTPMPRRPLPAFLSPRGQQHNGRGRLRPPYLPARHPRRRARALQPQNGARPATRVRRLLRVRTGERVPRRRVRRPRADFAPFWAVERALSSASPLNSTSPSPNTSASGSGWFHERVKAFAARLAADERDGRSAHGMSALRIRDGRVQRATYQGSYFDGDWEATIGKVCARFLRSPLYFLGDARLAFASSRLPFVLYLPRFYAKRTHTPLRRTQFASALPDMTLLITGRDEPRVVFDTQPLFAPDAVKSNVHIKQMWNNTHLTDPTPFALSPPSTAAFFAPRAGCGTPGEQGCAL
ncbi:hypothetical protein FB451DRAFT_1498406 [Mycena latifolia]|nr:hypothetical protein FB451DRAFT_1498406 [Mycena latifolia]